MSLLTHVFWHLQLCLQPSSRLQAVVEFQLFDLPSSAEFIPEVSCEEIGRM